MGLVGKRGMKTAVAAMVEAVAAMSIESYRQLLDFVDCFGCLQRFVYFSLGSVGCWFVRYPRRVPQSHWKA